MGSKDIKILIVDDDEGIRMSLARVLNSKGYDIRECRNAAAAFKVINSEFINLALIDIRLPDVNGLELLKALRAANDSSIAVMMTAYATLDSCVEALNMGAYAYIIKPMNINQALIIIEKAFEKQRLLFENVSLLNELKIANENLALQIEQLQVLQNEKSKLIEDLQKAIGEIKTLSGILSICSVCKKIRDDSGNWVQIESYVSNRVDVMFSHGMCPECAGKYYPKIKS